MTRNGAYKIDSITQSINPVMTDSYKQEDNKKKQSIIQNNISGFNSIQSQPSHSKNNSINKGKDDEVLYDARAKLGNGDESMKNKRKDLNE